MAGLFDDLVPPGDAGAEDDPFADLLPQGTGRIGSLGGRAVERIGGWDLPDEMPSPELAPPTPLTLRSPDPGPLGRIDTVQFRDGPTVRLPVPPVLDAQPPPQMPAPETFTRPQPRDYASLTTGQRAGDQLRSGVETLRQGLASLGLGGIYDDIDRLQRFEAGSLPEQELARAPVPFGNMSPGQRNAYRTRLEAAAGQKLAAIIASQQRQQLLASNPQARAMVEALNAGRWAEGWRAFASDPLGIVQQFAVESAPTSAAMAGSAIAGGALGGPAVGAASAFLSSAGLDFGPRTVEILMDALRERGVDVADEQAVAAALTANPTLARDAARRAGFGAGAMATFDAAGLGAGAGIRRGAGLGTNARTVGRNLGIEMASEPAGEAAAQLASTGEIKPGELAAELLGAGPQVVGTTAYGTLMEARQPSANPGQDMPNPIQDSPSGPTTSSGPAEIIPRAIPAPESSVTPGEFGVAPPPAPPNSTPSAPPPPAAASSSAAEAAQPPAGAPAAYAGAPPPAAVAAPPGAPNGEPPVPPGMVRLYHGSATHGRYTGPAWFSSDRNYAANYRRGAELQFVDVPLEWANAQQDPDGYGQGVDRGFALNIEIPDDRFGPRRPIGGAPAASPPAAPGAAAVPPAAPAAEPAGVGVPPPAPVVPSAPPPQPNTARASLEAALNQPSPEAQAALAAERAARLQAIQAGLPPGWRVVDEQGVVSVLDPNGDWMAQFEQPPADPAAAIEDARRVHEEGVRQGLYPNAADAAAAETNPAPTPAQAQAGNYRQGAVTLHGIPIRIETPRGATRSGVDPGGRPWSVQMPAHYGRIERTTGADGDQVDVYLGPRAEDPEAPVFVVDQVDAETGRFDEHKAMLGVSTEDEARALYDAAFSDGRGPQRRVAITRMSLAEFKAWLAKGDTRSPLNREAIKAGVLARRAEKHRQRQAEEARKKAEAEAKAKAAADQKAQQEAEAKAAQSRKIGVNAYGQELFEDGNGIRYVVEGRIRTFEPVLVRPDGARGPNLGQRAINPRWTPVEEADPPAPAPSETTGKSDQPLDDAEVLRRVGSEFAKLFLGDRRFATIAQARIEAARILHRKVEPGTHLAKVVDEAIELGVVLAARQIVGEGAGPEATYQKLVDLYDRQPRLGTRTSTSIENQAYSTPAPLAFLAATRAGIDRGSRVLEPTAGTGMLTITADPAKTDVNELDPLRREALTLQGFRPTGDDAARADFGKREVDAVIANPPFGITKDRDGKTVWFDMGFVQKGYETSEIDHAIALRALEALPERGGRAVLLLGGVNKQITGDKARADAYLKSRVKREFFVALYDHYRVVDHFTVAGELYSKQGAGWPIDVIVIAGRGKSALPYPTSRAPVVFSTWDALKEKLTDGRVADTDRAPDGVEPPGERPGGGRGATHGGGSEGGPRPADMAPADGAPAGVDGGAGSRPGGGSAGPRGGADGSRGADGTAGIGEPAGAPGAGGGGRDAVGGGMAGPAGADGTGAAPGAEPAAGGAGGAADQPGGVAGEGAAGGGRSDVGAAFDAALDDVFGPEEPAPPSSPPAPAAPRPPRTAGQAAASAVRNTAQGADAAMAALTQLFGGGKRLGSGIGWDEETWKAAKPLFQQAAAKFQAAGRDIREVMRLLLTELRDAYQWTREMVVRARPYIERFVEEVTAGRIAIGEQAAPEAAAPEAQETAPPKPKRQDPPTDRQVPYEPRNDAPGVGTLVPINMQTAVSAALAQAEERAAKPLVEFVAERLGYTPAQVRDYFSAEQVDAIALGINNLDDGQGFVIGDQTGVGKGRFVAAMIRYALRQNLIPVFVTEKDNLYKDMARDLTDIGMADALDRIIATNTGLNLPLTDEEEGVKGPRLKTLSSAAAQNEYLAGLRPDDLAGEKIVFTTYTQLQQQAKSDTPRIAFMRAIAPRAFLILDESHNAGGAAKADENRGRKAKPKGTDRGTLFRQFVDAAASAVFSSATWAKRPDVMDLYGRKTGMRFAVPNVEDLGKAISKGGVPMQQIASAMLARAGQYIRRERSFAGVTYDVSPVPVDRQTYDDFAASLAAINKVSGFVKRAVKESSEEIRDTAAQANGGDAGGAGAESTAFSALMHNLIGQMLLSSKAKAAADLAIEKARAGMKPVVTVANTMGSFIQEYAEDSGAKPGDRIDLTFNDLLKRYLDKTLVYRIRKPFSSEKAEVRQLTPEQLGEEGERAYRAAERLIASLDLSKFPLSPIDYMHAEFAKAGLRSGEITGRTETAEYRADGVYYQRRPASENTAKGKTKTISAFNSGALDIIVLNQSGATGLSLHASEKFKDQRKRVMIIAQAEANIDTHMQMLGRVHRTGQVVAPEYLQLFADVPAEKRPAAVLAKKMASLSAATTANRRGALSAENVVDFLNEYGDRVAFDIVEADQDLWRALGEPALRDEDDQPVDDAARKVSGRIPLLPLAKQEEVYQEIEKRYRAAIQAADEAGTNKLEAKTLELDAKPLDEKPWTEGKGVAGNIFAGPSKIVRYDVRKQTRPPAPHAIVRRAAESAGAAIPDVSEKTSLEDAADLLGGVALNAEDQWLPKQIAFVDAAARAGNQAINDRGDEISDKERQVMLNRITDNAARLRSILRLAQPGGLIGFTDDAGDQRAGLVLQVTRPGEKVIGAKVLAPSGWEITILTPEGERIQMALSGVFTEENRPAEEDAFVITAPPADASHLSFLEAIDAGSKERREERWIVTGNLLAGYAKRAGHIINFYTADGDLLQGIMMPANFDLAKFEAGQLPRFDLDQAFGFLFDRAVDMPIVETEDGTFAIARDNIGSFVLRADASKAKGGSYYLDKGLREALGVDFVKSGDTMRARAERFVLERAKDAIGRLLVRNRQDLVSKHPAAGEWKKRDETPRSPAGAPPLYSTPFDPEAFRRFFLDPAMAAFRAAAEKVREADLKALRKLWPAASLPPQVEVDASGRVPKGPLPLLSHLRLPNRMFRQWPSLAKLVEEGARAEERMSIWSTRMGGRLDRILTDLRKGGGKIENVQAALLDADANEVDIEKADVAQAHWEAHGLSPAEARAAADLNRLLVQVARLVDQHRRAMQPRVKAAKAKVWAAMQRIADSASVPGEDYAKLYRRRTYLNGRIRAGKGDLAAQGKEVEEINGKLRALRAADPAFQERLAELQAEYDALEARLQESSVRRRKGYFPHKFFGSWRLFELGEPDPETGEATRTEITSDQGFYDTLGEAAAAAREHLRENPGARLRIEPRMVSFPAMGGGGAVLSDAAYLRLRRGLEAAAGLEGDALNEALQGVARRRSRRRVLSASLLRKGAEGWSKDLERVMRTHIAQATRYVEMDKMKFRYVETTERLGLSPARAVAVRQEGMAEVQRVLEAWWRDLNGNKQAGEQQLDGLIDKLGLPLSTAAAFATGFVAGGGFANPVLAPLLGTYLGYRMARAVKKGGDFPTRTLMADVSNDLAHLKLGMLVNVASAVVNLTQTAINTYPVLGERWAAEGIRRAAAALWSQARNHGAPGRMSTDAILLTRADIRTRFSLSQDAPPLLVGERSLSERLRHYSMLPFHSVEVFNRAVAFLGAYARAEAAGKSPAQAMEEGRDVLRRTQFHQGQALRPEVLRNTLLRLPTQFKNFMAQQIGFVLGLRGKGEILRFVVAMFLVAGLLGLPGLQLVDWLLRALVGGEWSPVTWLKEQIILAGALGQTAGTAVDVLARGLPALLGVDITGRVGMGPGFLPDQGSDLAGPALGTVAQAKEVARQQGGLADYLMAMGPFAGPLRALEAAANGASVTSARFWSGEAFGDGEARLTNPRKRDQTEYHPTDGELAATALGFRPLRQALQADQREVQRHETEDRTRDANAYLSRIIQARWDGRMSEVPGIVAEARRAGVMLTQRQIVQAVRNAEMERAQRDMKRAPRDLRPGILERQQAIENRFQPAR